MIRTHPNLFITPPPPWPAHPEDEDLSRGTVLSRNDAAIVLAGAGGGALIGRSAFGKTDTCVARPVPTAGPYYRDALLERPDIRYDPTDESVQMGAPLDIAFVVTEVIDGVCVPLANAVVEISHCDTAGRYSGVSDGCSDTREKVFLRGYQVTDENGMVNFTTIYPGWCSGRAVHIHFKVRSTAKSASHFEFSSQLFFDDLLTDTVHAASPYRASGHRDTLNDEDPCYQENGPQLMLDVTSDDKLGYLTVFSIALDLDGSTAETLANLASYERVESAMSPAENALGYVGVLGMLLSLLGSTGSRHRRG